MPSRATGQLKSAAQATGSGIRKRRNSTISTSHQPKAVVLQTRTSWTRIGARACASALTSADQAHAATVGMAERPLGLLERAHVLDAVDDRSTRGTLPAGPFPAGVAARADCQILPVAQADDVLHGDAAVTEDAHGLSPSEHVDLPMSDDVQTRHRSCVGRVVRATRWTRLREGRTERERSAAREVSA